MGKHESFAPKTESRRDRKIHPIWRGVGFVFIVLIPFMSYYATQLILDLNKSSHWFPITPDMMAKKGEFLFTLFHDPMIYIYIVMIVSISAAGFALLWFVGILISGIFGKSRYGPYDLPPISKPRNVKMKAR